MNTRIANIVLTILLVSLAMGCLPTHSQYELGYSRGYLDATDDVVRQFQGYELPNIATCDLCINYPTTQDILDFVAEDDTDITQYDKLDYVCADYSDQLIERAWARGYPAYLVLLSFEDITWNHAIVAFRVSDSSELLLIDPMNDIQTTEEEIGEDRMYELCDENGTICKLYKVIRVRIFD